MSQPQLTDNATSTNEQGATVQTYPRPLDAFDGDACHRDDWISHFESVACVNTWDEPSKVLWLEVRLIGKAWKSWNWLSEESKGSYWLAKAALRNRLNLRAAKICMLLSFKHNSRNLGWFGRQSLDIGRTGISRPRRACEGEAIGGPLPQFAGSFQSFPSSPPEEAKAPGRCGRSYTRDRVYPIIEFPQIGKLSGAEDDLQPPPTVSARCSSKFLLRTIMSSR